MNILFNPKLKIYLFSSSEEEWYRYYNESGERIPAPTLCLQWQRVEEVQVPPAVTRALAWEQAPSLMQAWENK